MNPSPIELIQGHSPNSGRCHHGAQGVGARIPSKFHPDYTTRHFTIGG